METEAYPFTAGGRQLARALVGVAHDRMVELVLEELPEEDVRALALVLLAAEHPRYTETPEAIFGDSEPAPDSLTRTDAWRQREGLFLDLAVHLAEQVIAARQAPSSSRSMRSTSSRYSARRSIA